MPSSYPPVVLCTLKINTLAQCFSVLTSARYLEESLLPENKESCIKGIQIVFTCKEQEQNTMPALSVRYSMQKLIKGFEKRYYRYSFETLLHLELATNDVLNVTLF